MSDWSSKASRKFREKQQEIKLGQQLVRSKGHAEWRRLVELFEAEVNGFNIDSGKDVLSIEGGKGVMFSVCIRESPRRVNVLFNEDTNIINFKGFGEVTLERAIEIRPVTQSNSVYLMDENRKPVELEVAVRSILDEVLGIDNTEGD